MSTRKLRGFTIVEMLVVIAIIGIIMGMVLPAVMGSREKARQRQCSNNLRSLSMAVAAFESSKSRFPGSQELLLPHDPGTIPAGVVGHNKPASWFTLILSGIERDDLGDRWRSLSIPFGHPTLTSGLSMAKCPSASEVTGLPSTTHYVANAGFLPRPVDGLPLGTVGYLATAQRAANGLFLDRITDPKASVRREDISDGASSTIMLSENLAAFTWDSFGPLNPSTRVFRVNRGWSRDLDLQYHLDGALGPFPTGARFRNTMGFCYAQEPGAPAVNRLTGGSLVAPQTPVPRMMKINGQKRMYGEGTFAFAEIARPSSHHPGSVIVAMADGSVHFVHDEIAYHVYQQLLTPHGLRSDMPSRVSHVLSEEDY